MAKGAATQSFVSISKIRDGCVITEDGTMCAVVITNSLNLSLKSDDEQRAILLQFQNMLNSLDFAVQIMIQSRRLDIRPYLHTLEGQKKHVTEDLLKIQINEYIDFIKKFTETTNIMTKHFFVVIPYTIPLLSSSQKSTFQLPGGEVQTDDAIFTEHKIQLDQRIAVVIQSLESFGVHASTLGTEELIELYYKMYNPGEQDRPAPSITLQ